MVYNAAWVGVLLSPLARLYDRYHASLEASPLGRIRLFQEHFPFFLVATSSLFLLFPRYSIITIHLIRRLVLGQDLPTPDTSQVPTTPYDLAFFLLLFLATFLLSQRSRRVLLLLSSFPVSYRVAGRFDPPSMAMLFLLAVAVFGLIRLRLRRIVTVTLVCVASLTFMLLCNSLEPLSSSRIAAIARFQAALLPMLWYSIYEELPPKKRLSPFRMLTYLYMRFFMAPVATYRELFYPRKQSLSAVRFAGIKALYVVVYATVTIGVIDSLTEGIAADAVTGLQLLLFSYLLYVHDYCQLVILFNMITGVLRLFGIPIRDSFNYWLLARTPNEHWRRWNILLREWVITFVFYPIMRAKRWLFVAVMASLMISGLLHLAPNFLPGRFETYRVFAIAAYWIINGFAIYVVIKTPYLFPDALKRLGIGRNRVWDAVGIVLTSSFYAILTYAREHADNWSELVDYLSRLVQA